MRKNFYLRHSEMNRNFANQETMSTEDIKDPVHSKKAWLWPALLLTLVIGGLWWYVKCGPR
jgi:hypothetical protein